MTPGNPVWIILISGAVALLPLLVGLATSYLKLSIVLGLLKSGLGAQQVPGALVTAALSLSLTLFIMSPVLEASLKEASAIDLGAMTSGAGSASLGRLLPVMAPWRDFMKKHTGKRELKVMQELSAARGRGRAGRAGERESGGEPDPDYSQLLPAFMLTQLKQAFSMGFVLLLPFLVLDLVVANVLVGLGMFMVSPMMIALPLKLILFVLCDGWVLLARSLVMSYAEGGW